MTRNKEKERERARERERRQCRLVRLCRIGRTQVKNEFETSIYQPTNAHIISHKTL